MRARAPEGPEGTVPPPHGGGEPARAGAEPGQARAAVVAVHGRGGSPESMLPVAGAVDVPGVAWVAPRAAGGTWYPRSFLAPTERNEPGLSSALALLAAHLEELTAAGVPRERTVLLGFSQGGCLALEFAARNARRYGGVVGWSAGLIGPPGTPREYSGDLEGTPVFIGCSDVDPHVPLDRVRESSETFHRLGAEVKERIYPGMGHTVNQEELAFLGALLRELTATSG